MDILTDLFTYLLSYLLTLAIPKGAFAPKNCFVNNTQKPILSQHGTLDSKIIGYLPDNKITHNWEKV